MNPSYISLIYKQETGNNLTEFIDSTRLMQAKRLLHNENLRVGEAARRVGYETPSSFTRFLKCYRLITAGLQGNEYDPKAIAGMADGVDRDLF